MSRLTRLIRASLLLAAIGAFTPVAAADPYEEDPNLATHDKDYAAGTRAAENKDWVEVARLFKRSEIYGIPTIRTCRISSAFPTAT